jgi:hypothetical protein
LKKSQAELFGIIVVVVIVAVGMVLFFSLSKPKSQSNPIDSQISQTMLNSMMKSYVDCNRMGGGIALRDLIKKCANRLEACSFGSYSKTCEYANKLMENILDSTLKEWKKPYRLSISAGGAVDDLPDIVNGVCSDSSEKEAPGIFPIPDSPTIIVRLDICKN